MPVRAKFFVSKLENPEGATAAQVGLTAVCRGVENAMWAQATPSGYIQMSVLNTPAFEQFEKGAEYEVTFVKVAKPTPGDGHPIKKAVDQHGRIVCETCGLTMGYTDEAVERQSYLQQAVTEEALANYVSQHEQAFGKRVEA